MGYYYYGTTMMTTEKLFAEYINTLRKRGYPLPYSVSKTPDDFYILKWEDLKHFDQCIVSPAYQIVANHDQDTGYSFKVLSEGEDGKTFMDEGHSEADIDEEDLYIYEDFRFEMQMPENAKVAEEIEF